MDYLSPYPTFEAPDPFIFDEQFVVKSIKNKFQLVTLENLCKEETSNTVISHPYPSSIRLCLDDKGLSTHKNSSLGNWKCHLIKLNENFVDFAQEAKEFQSDFQTQSDLSKVVFARTVERDRPFTYVPTKTDLYVQIFRDTRTLNQSDHSKVIYAKLLKGKPCVFPAISRNHSEARITSAEFSRHFWQISATVNNQQKSRYQINPTEF